MGSLGEPQPRPAAAELAVVVVSFNTRELTLRCLRSVERATRDVSARLWLVDNASSDGTVDSVRSELPRVEVIANQRNLGYGSANNQAMRLAQERQLLLLNSDVELSAGALARMREELQADPLVGALGCWLVGPDGRRRPSARRYPSAWRELLQRFRLHRLLPRAWRSRTLLGEHALAEHARRPDWVTGACLLVRREAFLATGGFDESIFLYGEELDWCARLSRARWRVGCVPDAEVMHVGRASSGPALGRRRLPLSLEGDLRYLSRYRGRWALGAFALVRTLGLAFETLLAALQADGEAVRAALYQLRAHLALAPRYLAARAGSSG